MATELDMRSYLSVIETITLYGRHLDDGNFDAWMDLFDPAIRLRVRGKTYVGRKGLEDFLSQRAQGAIKHMMSMPLISSESSCNCTAATDFLALRNSESGVVVAGSGRFNDRLQLSTNRWLFVEKTAMPSAGF